MAEVAPYNADETRRLERFPFYVFFLVAGADGVIDEKEFERFVHGLIDYSSELGGDDVGADVMLIANSDRYFDTLHPEVKRIISEGGTAAALTGIQDGVALLNARLDAATAASFKQRMMTLAHSVAAASGGFLGVGSVSKVEKDALVQLSAILGVAI